MKTLRSVILLAGLCALSGPAFAQAPAAQQGFDAYRVLRTRNIFDPDRNPFVPVAAPRPRYVAQPRRAATDYVTLTGIMVNDGKALAFFSGSRADDDKVIGLNAEIAGARLTQITPTGVEVDRAGKKISVSVGQTVPFDGSAPGAPPPPAAGDTAGGPPSAPAPAGDVSQNPTEAPTPLPGNLDNVMRQMMERRQKELQ